MHLHETACPMVSIIIPTYNNEARIARTLENIISQDYPNIEIIVVNDVGYHGGDCPSCFNIMGRAVPGD